jgi:non-SMC mitotic condensation complex subunit 1, N-term
MADGSRHNGFAACHAHIDRSFAALPSQKRARCVDVLSSNLDALSSSCSSLLAGGESVPGDAAAEHRTAAHMLVHLLQVLSREAERCVDSDAAAASAIVKPKPAGVCY